MEGGAGFEDIRSGSLKGEMGLDSVGLKVDILSSRRGFRVGDSCYD